MNLNRAGATLVEVLLATVITVFLVSSISVFFPKAASVLIHNRQRWLATNLVASHIQQVKSRPYDLITVTPQANFTAPAAATCNCSRDNFTKIPTVENITQNGITYGLQDCVNLVDYDAAASTWTSHCPDMVNFTDNYGIKYIQVRSTWTYGPVPNFTTMSSMVNR